MTPMYWSLLLALGWLMVGLASAAEIDLAMGR